MAPSRPNRGGISLALRPNCVLSWPPAPEEALLLVAGLLYLQHTFDRSFRVDSITNRNCCGCLSSELSPVKLRVAPLVRVSRAINAAQGDCSDAPQLCPRCPVGGLNAKACHYRRQVTGKSLRVGFLQGVRLQTAPVADASSKPLHRFFSNRKLPFGVPQAASAARLTLFKCTSRGHWLGVMSSA